MRHSLIQPDFATATSQQVKSRAGHRGNPSHGRLALESGNGPKDPQNLQG